MLKIKNKYLLLIYLAFFIPCLAMAKESKISAEAQAYIDEINFNIQVMQGKTGLEEIIQENRLGEKQIERYKQGKSSNFIVTGKDVYATNYISFHKALSPKYFIPSTSIIRDWSNDTGLSVKIIANALGLDKRTYSGKAVRLFYGGDSTLYFNHEYDVISPSIPYNEVRVRFKVLPPEDYIEGNPLDLAIVNNIASVTVAQLSHTKQKIPVLRSGEATTRNGFWQASVSKNHPKADVINHSPPIYLQWKEVLPDFGLEQKDAKKIKWTWVNDDVEQLKELMEKEKGEQ